MNDELTNLERRKVELDRKMENLRGTICSANFQLEGMKLEKRALIERIAKLKAEPK